jgi:hypothetical protein
MNPPAEAMPATLPLARTHPELLTRRVLWCRCCGQDCEVAGAVLCAACWPLVPAERRLVLTSGHPPVDPTVVEL